MRCRPPGAISRILIAGAHIAALSLRAQSPSERVENVVGTLPHFSKDAFRAHMAFLADDLLEGRGTGTRGHEIAAKYIATQFEAMGLQAAGENGTFFQRVPLREIAVDSSNCSATLLGQGIAQSLKWGEDFIMSGSPWNENASVEAPVVFVGYGVISPVGQYDDYTGVDVRGKIVALLRGAPPIFGAELRAHLSSTREKWRLANEHGAVGILNLRVPEAERVLPWERVVETSVFPSMRWLGPNGQPNDFTPGIRASAFLSVIAS